MSVQVRAQLEDHPAAAVLPRCRRSVTQPASRTYNPLAPTGLSIRTGAIWCVYLDGQVSERSACGWMCEHEALGNLTSPEDLTGLLSGRRTATVAITRLRAVAWQSALAGAA